MFQPMSLGFMDHSQQSESADFLMEDDDDDSQDHLGQAETNTNSSQRKAEIRKSNKPVMEKKRRARINNCLNDLKAILLEAMRKDPARHSKLEKADILELTVRHLQNVQRNQLAIAMASDPTVLHRFKNGFAECLTEVNRYMGKLDGIDQGMRHRLTGHLTTCITGLQQVTPTAAFGAPVPPPPIPVLPVPLSHFNPNIMVMPTNLSSNCDTTSGMLQPGPGQGHGGIKAEARSSHQPMASQLVSQDMNNNTSHNRHTSNGIERQHFPSALSFITAESYRSLNRTPPPSQNQQSSGALISPPNSSDTDDTSMNTSASTSTSLNNTSLSSNGGGSDISICTGSEKGTNTSPNSFAKSAAASTARMISSESLQCPIDFSLKFKETPVRVLKVEPIMMAVSNSQQDQERLEAHNNVNRSRRTILGSKDSMWRPW